MGWLGGSTKKRAVLHKKTKVGSFTTAPLWGAPKGCGCRRRLPWKHFFRKHLLVVGEGAVYLGNYTDSE